MARRIWAVILVAVMLVACSAVVFATEDDLEIMPSVGFRIGDVNMDKAVNVKDATLVQKFIANLETLSADQKILADADLDINVNIKDATYIQKQVAGLVKPAVPTSPEETTEVTIAQTEAQTTVAETTTQGIDETEPTAEATDPTESAGTTVPEAAATESPEATTAPTQLTDPTEEPTTETTPKQTEETTAPTTTRDPNKPIELPFIPAE